MKWGLKHIFESKDIDFGNIDMLEKRKKAKAKKIYIDFALKNKLILEAFKKLEEGEKK
ncbi:hypothetical protein [Aliarcobacter butzleri]|uniref:hypothetical protein n=1 Tax=Aliarcobacter butzleri TaxID=28197 RepID=UPI00186A92F8|nr:hypothetical protein [Aliarcobacter butzleri]